MNKILILAILVCLSIPSFAVNHPFPQGIKYKYGIKPTVSQEAMNQVVRNAFEDWLSRYVTAEGCPEGAYRVHRYLAYDFDTVSEGTAWGMLIMVLMENDNNQTQKYFDGLWKYYKHHLNEAGLMSWKINREGKALDHESATEADENAAMALLYADQQWGSQGKSNYLQEAKSLISNILSFEVEEKTHVLKPGSNWGGSNATNPCYFDSAYYRIWEKFDKKWAKVSKKCLDIYDIFYSRYDTGLYPDWCKANGSASFLGYDYTYDACQVPLKIGIDYLWNGKGKKYLEKFTSWIIKKTDSSPHAIVDGYKLDGSTLGKYHNAAFVGPTCVAAMVSEKYQYWLNALYADLVNMETGGRWGYYNDTLRLVSLIIVSGNMPDHWRDHDQNRRLPW